MIANNPKTLHKRNMLHRLLCNIIDEKNILKILELGNGKKSTVWFRDILKEKNNSYCLSIENNERYYKYISSLVTDSDQGRIEFSHLVWDDKAGLHYDYDLSSEGKYDLIFIDGPGNAFIYDKKKKELDTSPTGKMLCIDYMKNRQDVCLNGEYTRGGACRLFMFDYCMSCIKKNTIIVIDGSKTAVLYFYQKHHNRFNFYNFGGIPKFSKNKNKALKKEFLNKINFIPSIITVIVPKDSTTSKKIIKKLSVSYN